MNLFGGTLVYTTKDTIFGTDSTIKLTIDSYIPDKYLTTSIFIRKRVTPPVVPYLPPEIRGSVSSGGNIETGGNLIVDGRDHDESGALIPGSGSYGVWTSGTLDQKGSSTIGGTSPSGIDYVPSKPALAGSYKDTSSITVASTPDQVLGGATGGFPEGTLKAIAQSGISGSQFVTNPGNLTYPLTGVTYIELPAGGSWEVGGGVSLDGSGILVVRNTAGNAAIKNLNNGTFKGIIIADIIQNIHNRIIGSVFPLNTLINPQIGNGGGEILYSQNVIKTQAALAKSSALSLTTSPTNNFGFGNSRLYINGWWE